MSAGQKPNIAIETLTGRPAEFLFAAKDNRGLPGQFAYWRGENGHVFLDPVPADLDRYYAEGYQPIPESEADLAKVAKGDAYRLDHIKKLQPTGTFLEIGPWIGLTAYSAKQAGYAVSAIERDSACVDLLRRCGIKAIQSFDPAETLENLDESFDVIGMWHSIEHLPRPWEVLRASARRLNPGGILVVAAPNPESAQFRVLGKHWVHLDAPRHIHFLPIALVKQLCENEGLALVAATSDDHLGLMLEEHGWRSEIFRRAFNIPGLKTVLYRLGWQRLRAKHRVAGAIDGAGYSLIFQRPPGS
ncbi:class I SAM-dependent methyltransferase [Novosphingobium sp.]|uniref:class I SAM-dependent methyltransferase n=1 Tax=Novosphingobium sp. TaxID=1874826 RepID=UPI00286A5A4E|nr:class I SAM-dependent methyltransferase [Novosphingobium sp.]